MQSWGQVVASEPGQGQCQALVALPGAWLVPGSSARMGRSQGCPPGTTAGFQVRSLNTIDAPN